MADGIETVGSKLRARREALGLSLRQAGRLAQPPLSANYLTHIENDEIKSPRIAVAPQLAQAYITTVPYIMEAFGVSMETSPEPDNLEALRIGTFVMTLPEEERHMVEDFAGFLLEKAKTQPA